ncbi:MAG: phosphatidylglycerophosphatase A [Deltaproteobacteria bacterium]|nr:phosphatidylglycerophosphatase A [Deltaproteobacteria bacterium]
MKGQKPESQSGKGPIRNADKKARVILFFATWFFTGLIPFAPGTWGSLAALPFAVLAYNHGLTVSCLSMVLIILVSIPVSESAASIMGLKDPPSVVIDEAAGVFVTLFLIPVSWTNIITGLILFRIFDIFKPFPAGLIDKKVRGGAGIVLDDIVAGIYANLGLRVILALTN